MTIAEQRIQAARATKATSLDLRRCELRSLPDLSGLESLKELDFSSNQVQDISPLQALNNLQKLNLLYNQVQDISPLLALSNLQKLDFSQNQVQDISPLQVLSNLQHLAFGSNQVQDISPLQALSNLQALNFWGNRVQDISPLEALSNLQTLSFGDNKVQDISPLQALSNLQSLDFWNNQVQDISPLQALSNLQSLDFDGNEVQDISALQALSNLQNLDFSSNQVQDISPLQNLIAKKQLSVKWIELGRKEGIYLKGNPFTNPPIEIVKQGNKAILAYWEEIEKYKEVYFNQAKVLILGEGGDGKTSLLYKLQNEDNVLPQKGENTFAIDIVPLTFETKEGRELQMNVWDFGGQEIYKATHQFFLSENAVYVLLYNTRHREGNLHNPEFVYWLEVAKLYGGSNIEQKECNAKVLIFQNEEGDAHKELSLPNLIAQFPQVHNEQFAVNLAAITKQNQTSDWKKFKANLKQVVEHLPNLQRPISSRWLKVKEQLEALHQSGKYIIRYQEYLEDICKPLEMSEENARFCSRFLHELGVCLHFQDNESLNEWLILEKTWATKAVYEFFIDKTVVQQQYGKMTKSDRDRIWTDAKYKHFKPQLLELMERFELCYPLDNQRDAFLIPQLLSSNAPEYAWNKSDNLILRYAYHFLPKGLISRLIVRLYTLIYSNSKGEKTQWKTGVVLQNIEKDTQAEIIEYYPSRYLEIRLTGKRKRELLSTVMWQIEDLHNEFKDLRGKTSLKVEKKVPCNCGYCEGRHFFNEDTLVAAEEQMMPNLPCDISKKLADVKKMRHGTFTPEPIQSMRYTLSKGKLAEVLERLAYITGKAREVVLLQARYSQTEEKKRQMSHEDYTLSINQLSADVLSVINRLDEEDAWQWTMRADKYGRDGGDFRHEIRGEFVRIHAKLADIHADTSEIKISLQAHQSRLLEELKNIESGIRYEQPLWEQRLSQINEKQTAAIERIIREIDSLKEEEGKKGIARLHEALEANMGQMQGISQATKTILDTLQQRNYGMDTQLKLKIPLIPESELLPFMPSLSIEHSVMVDSGELLTKWWASLKKKIFG